MRDYRRENLRRYYGISPEEFEAQLAIQGGRCAICRVKLTVGVENARAAESAVVDHNHDDDSLRGILCNHCNRGIGLLGDSVDGAFRAVEYLENPVWHGPWMQPELFPYTL
jgi:hypothetical protein